MNYQENHELEKLSNFPQIPQLVVFELELEPLVTELQNTFENIVLSLFVSLSTLHYYLNLRPIY